MSFVSFSSLAFLFFCLLLLLYCPLIFWSTTLDTSPMIKMPNENCLHGGVWVGFTFSDHFSPCTCSTSLQWNMEHHGNEQTSIATVIHGIVSQIQMMKQEWFAWLVEIMAPWKRLTNIMSKVDFSVEYGPGRSYDSRRQTDTSLLWEKKGLDLKKSGVFKVCPALCAWTSSSEI